MYIHVKVTPSAKKESFVKKNKDHFLVSVRERAERNLANKRVIELVSKHFGSHKVLLVSGHNSPSKLFSVGD
ncbi:MAG: DUF167 domain-containing protein [bacterium]